MNKFWLFVIFLSFGFTISLSAQSIKNPRYSEKDFNYDRGATYETAPQKVKVKKNRKIKGDSYNEKFDDKVKEYYARMEANAKKYKKMEREMKKPQYSDPTYFGHKHPPKKRPPGKKKYCKICGMYH